MSASNGTTGGNGGTSAAGSAFMIMHSTTSLSSNTSSPGSQSGKAVRTNTTTTSRPPSASMITGITTTRPTTTAITSSSLIGRKSAAPSQRVTTTHLTKPTKPTKTCKPTSNALPLSPSAHPRTDPLNALTALRKLLLSLVSSASSNARMGGCTGYRMTKEEHALAVHLVGIVDPFVYRGVRASGGVGLTGVSAGAGSAKAAASQTSDNMMAIVLRKPTFLGMADTPTEIIDYILSFVESKSDLLSVALCSRRLYDLVFPRHWEYRVVRCKVSDGDVWKHLCADRSLARNVRVLEILDERVGAQSAKMGSTTRVTTTALVPHTLLKRSSSSSYSNSLSSSASEGEELDIHKKHERHLSAALLRMTGLTELKWSCVHSPVSLAKVWGAISVRASGLRVLEVADNLMFGPLILGDGSGTDSNDEGEVEAGDRLGRVRLLLSMETAVFRSTAHGYGASKTPDISRIGSMLTQCPNLKALEITYVPVRSSQPSLHQTQAPLQPHLTNTNARPRPLLDAFLLSSLLPSSFISDTSPTSSLYLQHARWPSLTRVTLTNLRCSSPSVLSAFLSAHLCVEVLELVDLVLYVPAGGGAAGANGNGSSMLNLQSGALPRLREVNAARDIITAIMECPLDSGLDACSLDQKTSTEDHGDYERDDINGPDDDDNDNESDGNDDADDEVDIKNRIRSTNRSRVLAPAPSRRQVRRPLETIKGFKLSGNPHHTIVSHNPNRPPNPDDRFLAALRTVTSIRRVEMAGWHDMDEVRRVVACVPRVTWLDVGRRIGGGGGSFEARDMLRERGARTDLRKGKAMERMRAREEVMGGSGNAPSNMLEWTDLLATLPDLATMHGVKFFYEVSHSSSLVGGVMDNSSSNSHHDCTSMADSGPSTSTTLNLAPSSNTNANISSATRSRLRKNDEIASVLAWRCPRLRRVDHWEGSYAGCGKVVVLIRDSGAPVGGASVGDYKTKEKAVEGSSKGKGKERERDNVLRAPGEKVRWEVRRVKM